MNYLREVRRNATGPGTDSILWRGVGFHGKHWSQLNLDLPEVAALREQRVLIRGKYVPVLWATNLAKCAFVHRYPICEIFFDFDSDRQSPNYFDWLYMMHHSETLPERGFRDTALLALSRTLKLDEIIRRWNTLRSMCVFGSRLTFKVFIDYGADLKQKSEDGDTLLQVEFSPTPSDWKKFDYLLSLGVDPQSKNDNGLNVLLSGRDERFFRYFSNLGTFSSEQIRKAREFRALKCGTVIECLNYWKMYCEPVSASSSTIFLKSIGREFDLETRDKSLVVKTIAEVCKISCGTYIPNIIIISMVYLKDGNSTQTFNMERFNLETLNYTNYILENISAIPQTELFFSEFITGYESMLHLHHRNHVLNSKNLHLFVFPQRLILRSLESEKFCNAFVSMFEMLLDVARLSNNDFWFHIQVYVHFMLNNLATENASSLASDFLTELTNTMDFRQEQHKCGLILFLTEGVPAFSSVVSLDIDQPENFDAWATIVRRAGRHFCPPLRSRTIPSLKCLAAEVFARTEIPITRAISSIQLQSFAALHR